MATSILTEMSDTTENPGDCTLCHEQMTAAESLTRAYNCRQIFHEHCVQSWDTYSFLCPCYRARKSIISDVVLPSDARLRALRMELTHAATYHEKNRINPTAFIARYVRFPMSRPFCFLPWSYICISVWSGRLMLNIVCHRLEEGRNKFIAEWSRSNNRHCASKFSSLRVSWKFWERYD